MAIGYCNNVEETKKVFTYRHITKEDIERIYHTGDLGYYDNNGQLYFAGRADFQIKHMGHRIELEEIEKALDSVNDIEHACCFFDDKKNKVVAYYVGDATKKDIINNMRKKVPEYMIPNVYRPIDKMPLTKNGKTDRKLLKIRYTKDEDVTKKQ